MYEYTFCETKRLCIFGNSMNKSVSICCFFPVRGDITIEQRPDNKQFPVGDKPIICISPTGNDYVICRVSIDMYSLREKERIIGVFKQYP